PTGFITTADGQWNTGSTWVGGVVPTPADNVIVAHDVTSALPITRDAGTTTTINPGAFLRMTNSYVNNGTTTVNGQFDTGTAGGVSIYPGSTFLVNGTFQINQSGFIQTGSPVYGSSSTLVYNIDRPAAYGRGLEWIYDGIGTIGVSPGYPNNVT